LGQNKAATAVLVVVVTHQCRVGKVVGPLQVQALLLHPLTVGWFVSVFVVGCLFSCLCILVNNNQQEQQQQQQQQQQQMQDPYGMQLQYLPQIYGLPPRNVVQAPPPFNIEEESRKDLIARTVYVSGLDHGVPSLLMRAKENISLPSLFEYVLNIFF
jgi:hypothetical protein